MRRCWILLVALTLVGTAPLAAQDADSPEPLEVGAVAPDFELPAATRYGTLEEPVRLQDFTGQVVVLAFFFKARTPG